MKGNSRMARWGALVGAAALTALTVGFASPASAADIGTLSLNGATTGSVLDSPMFASATTSVPCPTGYGTNASLQVGRVGTAPPYATLAPIGALGGYDTAPFSLAPNRSMARALGGPAATSVADGTYEILVQCVSDVNGDFPDYFRSATVSVASNVWTLNTPAPPAVTTTTLTASPANDAPYLSNVTLSAALTPAAATGTVTFKRGTTTIGTAPVTGGVASISTNALPLGSHTLSASFAPTGNFLPSTSNNLPYQITSVGTIPTADENLNADIAPGAFTLSVAATPVNLTGGIVGGTATGNMNPATVTDLRGNGQAWNLTGQVSDFTAGTNTINANQLGWAPNAHNVNSEAGLVVAGPTQAPVTSGLGTARTLCNTAAGLNAGVFECGAGLTLKIPQSAAPGAYAATLTLTLI